MGIFWLVLIMLALRFVTKLYSIQHRERAVRSLRSAVFSRVLTGNKTGGGNGLMAMAAKSGGLHGTKELHGSKPLMVAAAGLGSFGGAKSQAAHDDTKATSPQPIVYILRAVQFVGLTY